MPLRHQRPPLRQVEGDACPRGAQRPFCHRLRGISTASSAKAAEIQPQLLSIAVNVSAVQIHSPHFVGLVHEVLLRSGLAPARLEVEVTETARLGVRARLP